MLALHVLDDDVENVAERGAVFEHPPRNVGVEVDLNQALITDREQAVAGDVLRDVVVDGVLIEVVAFDEELRVIDIFEHGLRLLFS